MEGPHKLRVLGARLRQYLAVDESEEEPPPVLAEDAQEAPPPAIDAQLVGRTAWVFCPEPEDPTDLTTYPGGWWEGTITMYYTPQEAQQTATDLGLQDAGFNVQFHFYDGVDEWQLYLRLDLDKYDPWVDELSEPAEWAWSLEEPPPVLAEDAQEAPPPAIDAQLVGRTVGACASKPGGAVVVNDGC